MNRISASTKDNRETKLIFGVFCDTNLYIAQAKAALGIKERENYNKPKNPNSKKLVCPPDKMAAIQKALRHFKMI